MGWKLDIVSMDAGVQNSNDCYELTITSNLLLGSFPFFCHPRYAPQYLHTSFPDVPAGEALDFTTNNRLQHAMPQNRIVYMPICRDRRGDLHNYITHITYMSYAATVDQQDEPQPSSLPSCVFSLLPP
jgi:hypothetical protein